MKALTITFFVFVAVVLSGFVVVSSMVQGNTARAARLECKSLGHHKLITVNKSHLYRHSIDESFAEVSCNNCDMERRVTFDSETTIAEYVELTTKL